MCYDYKGRAIERKEGGFCFCGSGPHGTELISSVPKSGAEVQRGS